MEEEDDADDEGDEHRSRAQQKNGAQFRQPARETDPVGNHPEVEQASQLAVLKERDRIRVQPDGPALDVLVLDPAFGHGIQIIGGRPRGRGGSVARHVGELPIG